MEICPHRRAVCTHSGKRARFTFPPPTGSLRGIDLFSRHAGKIIIARIELSNMIETEVYVMWWAVGPGGGSGSWRAKLARAVASGLGTGRRGIWNAAMKAAMGSIVRHISLNSIQRTNVELWRGHDLKIRWPGRDRNACTPHRAALANAAHHYR